MNLRSLLHIPYKEWFSALREHFAVPQPATAVRDWQILLIVALALLTLLAAYALYFFFEMEYEEQYTKETETTEGVHSLDRSQLESVLERLERREAALGALERSSSGVVDPSR